MENRSVNPDEIYLPSCLFGGSAGMKLRPLLLLTGPVGGVPEVLVAYLSSGIPPRVLPSDILLDPGAAGHAPTHLKTTSVLRLHKLAAIHAWNVVRRLGVLSSCRASTM
jgi:mRNA interferase MazF